MQGPSPGMSMSQMMRGPKSTEFFPTLIRIPEPDPVERERLEQRAEQWMSEGFSLLSEGTAALSESMQRDDLRAMEVAGATIDQGLSQLKSGLSARRALESGESPPEVALEWSPLVPYIRAIAAEGFEGTATELLGLLDDRATS